MQGALGVIQANPLLVQHRWRPREGKGVVQGRLGKAGSGQSPHPLDPSDAGLLLGPQCLKLGERIPLASWEGALPL